MTHRLGDLVSGAWRPLHELHPESVDRIAALASDLVSLTGTPDRGASVYFVPGRIEVLGKHTDYAGGRSLVTATEQGILMVCCPRRDSLIRLLDTTHGQMAEIESVDPMQGDPKDWTVYPRAVAHRLGPAVDQELRGADIVFNNTLPLSAGLSSSSVLLIATYLALARCNHLDRNPRFAAAVPSRESLAGFLGAVENGRSFGPFPAAAGVGTRGGDQDHTAILCAGRGEIRQYRFLPTVLERAVELPPNLVFAVAVSGVRAEKTGAALDDYNRISTLAGRLEQIWTIQSEANQATLGSIVRDAAGGAQDLEELIEGLHVESAEKAALRRRLRQFWQESEEIIPAAADALTRGDLGELGRWIDLSMRLATELLGNQIEETVWLAAAARDLGAVAASAFGAGFGGAVWTLVEKDGVEDFLKRWSEGYLKQFPGRRGAARFFSTAAGGPATEL